MVGSVVGRSAIISRGDGGLVRVRVGAQARGSRGGRGAVVAHEQVLEVVVGGDRNGGQLVDERGDDLGRGGSVANVVRGALCRAGVGCLDGQRKGVAPSRP